MKLKKLLICIAAAALTAVLLAGCAGEPALSALTYYDQLPQTEEEQAAADAAAEAGTYGGQEYNKELFYRNDLDLLGADPFVLYIDDEDSTEYGYYYLYATCDYDLAVQGLGAWRSKDLENWERVGGMIFDPYITDTWANVYLFAPEVVYDEEEDLYFLFSSAYGDPWYEKGTAEGLNIIQDRLWTGFIATSENPYGPFVQYAPPGGSIADSTFLDPIEAARAVKERGDDYCYLDDDFFDIIDFHPFVASDGTKYLYMVTNNADQASIYGCELLNNDWRTPDLSTLVELVAPRYYTIADRNSRSSDTVIYEEGSSINEGPFVLEHEGKYYLTFSVYGCTDKRYSVAQAVADDPLGPYTKLDYEDGGIILSADGGTWDFVSGTGHHCFVQAGDELIIFYHQHLDRLNGNSQRAFSFDRAVWAENADGLPVLYCNGPTWSIQPQLHINTEYRNIAPDATVTAENSAEGGTAENVGALTDGLLSLYSFIDYVPEFSASAGQTVITLAFGDWRTVRAVMVYNSKNFDTAFGSVARIEFDFLRPDNGETGTACIDSLGFDWNFYFDRNNQTMRPGGSATAEFDELQVKEIRITLASQAAVNVSEIVVLGK